MEDISIEAAFSWVLNEKKDSTMWRSVESDSRQREQQAQRLWDGDKVVMYEEEKVDQWLEPRDVEGARVGEK